MYPNVGCGRRILYRLEPPTNRTEFGVLVACLREDLRWSQAELAERAELGLAALNGIEAGRRADLADGDTLLRLANGLLLTSRERREFLLAASGVEQARMMRPDIGSQQRQFDIAAFLQQLGEHISRLQIPVYITDSYCDVLMVNRCALGFYAPPEGFAEEAARTVGGFNQMHYVFHHDSSFRGIIGEQEWNRLALLNVRHFRWRTLRYRHKSYCSALIKQFLSPRKYPYFERYWRKVAFEIEDDFAIPAAAEHPRRDRSYVETESLLALTPHGEIYQHQLLPANKATARTVQAILKEAGEGFVSFARLPDRRKE